MLKALLVDFDGTLVDSERANAAAYADALAQHGLPTDPAALLPRIAGRAWRDFLPELLAHHPHIDPAAVAEQKRAHYPRDYLCLIRPNHALAGLIRAARHGGLATALVTTASPDSTQAILARFGFDTLFDTAVFGTDVTRPKPDPEAYRLAADRLGVAAADCIALEDSPTGVAAARAFGAHLLRWDPPS